MSVWNDRERWAALCSGEECPICRRGKPLDVVATLEASWVTLPEDAPIKGYVCLVSRTHAVELHDLPEEQALAFMRDARRVSKALAIATGAVKLNYEIHGNSIPHLHMHFFPRRRGDQFEGQPINPKARCSRFMRRESSRACATPLSRRSDGAVVRVRKLMVFANESGWRNPVSDIAQESHASRNRRGGDLARFSLHRATP
jgi:diadenosine tetraphosphate (Ap4A) HIT family hydrolase